MASNTNNPLLNQNQLAQIQNTGTGMGAAFGGLLGGSSAGYCSSQYDHPYASRMYELEKRLNELSSKKTQYLINVEKCDNGHIIRVGKIVRIAPKEENLAEHIAAAIMQHELTAAE